MDTYLFKSKILKDTAVLTIMQLFLDSAALLLNVFITKQLGASAIGILTLTGSFLGLAGILSNGNAFLCTSRLISEELGKPGGDPNRILMHGIKLCLMLSLTVSAVVFLFADMISDKFFSGADMTTAIRIMPAALISGAIASCIKGYFNADRRASIPAVCDVLEFIIKSGYIVTVTLMTSEPSEARVCGIMIGGIIAGNLFSLVFLLTAFAKLHRKNHGRGSISFLKYISFALPIMGGSILTSALSSANDALIPVCLRQNGDSVKEALSSFGIFEAIVIPTLFFPSVVLCSMSGIIVSESARAAASRNKERIRSISERLIKWTLVYAIFAASVLMRFGRPIGELLGGGEEAGHLIVMISPVIPFIYMEIVLEAMIKGMGLQAFSSLNYLAEYAIRITIVLIFVPKFGLYGVAASYYTSNVFGNCSRFIKILRVTGVHFRPIRTIGLPVLYSWLTMKTLELLMRPILSGSVTIPTMAVFTVLWVVCYMAILTLLPKSSISHGARYFSTS